MGFFKVLSASVCLALVVSFSVAETPDIIQIPLQWKAISGAGGYRLELKDATGQITLTEDLTETKTTLSLEPGTYELRVSTLNRFGKPEAGTPWTPLTIKPIPVPEISSVRPASIPEDEPATVVVTGKGEDEKTTWLLVPEQGSPLSLVPKVSGEGWSFTLPALAQGTYTLRATGKTGKVGQLATAVTVRPHDALVSGWSLVTADAQHPLSVEFKGRYLYPGTTFVFSAGNLRQTNSVSAGQDLTRVTLPLPQDAGTYAISVEGFEASRTVIPSLTVLPVPQLAGVVPTSGPTERPVVALPLVDGSPNLRIFVEYGRERHEIENPVQSATQLSFAVPASLSAPGNYRLWIANSQGREAALAEGLTIKNDGSVQGSPASVKVVTDQADAKVRLGDGIWVELPHTFEGLEAGKNYRLSFSNVYVQNQLLASPAVSYQPSPHEVASIKTNYVVGHGVLKFTDLPADSQISVNELAVAPELLSQGNLTVESGDMTIDLQSPAGQRWTKNLTLLPDATIETPLDSYLPIVPQRKIVMDGPEEWEGLVPIVTSTTSMKGAFEPGSQVKRLWSSRDESSLYFRLDLDGPPLSGLAEADYGLVFGTGKRLEIRTNFANGKGTTFVTNLATKKSSKVGSFVVLPTGLEMKIPFDELYRLGFDDSETLNLNHSVAYRLAGAERVGVPQDPLTSNQQVQIQPWDEPPKPTVPTVSTLAFGFTNPTGVAVDSQNAVYVADTGSNSILKVLPDGTVTKFAGSGKAGRADGNGASASFDGPVALALAPDGNLYVAESQNRLIRKISPKGQVTTFAGSKVPYAGSDDGKGIEASFLFPAALAVDRFGTIFVLDVNASPRFHLRKITPDGMVTTIVESALSQWFNENSKIDSTGTFGLTVSGTGVLTATVPTDHALLRIDETADQQVVAISDNFGTKLRKPTALTSDSSGNLYVVDATGQKVLRVSPSGTVTTIAGTGQTGTRNGAGSVATFNGPCSLTTGPDGALYLSDSLNQKVRKIFLPPDNSPEPIWSVTTPLPAGTLNFPTALTQGSDGSVYGIDGNRIFKRTPEGGVEILAGGFEEGDKDGPGPVARFRHPEALVAINATTIVVADTQNNKLRVVGPSGVSTIKAGSWARPRGIALGQDGSLYVSDAQNHRIMKGGLEGAWKVFASSKQVNAPGALAFDRSGNLYVIDGSQIKEINPQGVTIKLAGGDRAGTGTDLAANWLLSVPRGLVVDRRYNLYVADTGSDQIRQISPEGVMTTIAGRAKPGNLNAFGPDAAFDHPWGITLTADGSLIVADSMNQTLRKLATDQQADFSINQGGVPKESETVIPVQRTIKMDGQLEGWAGIRPVKTKMGSSFWENIPGTAINAIYFAEDRDYLYWMMTTSDGRNPPNVPVNFEVGLHVGQGYMGMKFNGWTPRAPQIWYQPTSRPPGRTAWDSTTSADYFLGDGFVEVRFPLKVLRKLAGTEPSHRFWAKTYLGASGIRMSDGTHLGDGDIQF